MLESLLEKQYFEETGNSARYLCGTDYRPEYVHHLENKLQSYIEKPADNPAWHYPPEVPDENRDYSCEWEGCNNVVRWFYLSK